MVGMYIIIPIVTFHHWWVACVAGHAFPSEVEVRLRASRGGEGGRGDKEEQDAGSKGEVSSFESGLGKTGITA